MFSQSPVKGSKNALACFFSAGTVDCHAPSARLILWLPVRVTKHCCFLAYLPAAGFRGTTGTTIQAWKNKKTTLLVTLQTLSISCAESHTFLLQALVKRRQMSLLKNPNVAVFVFFRLCVCVVMDSRIPNKRCLLL